MKFQRGDFKNIVLGVFLALTLVLFFADFANAQNGSLYFSPTSGQFSAGQRFSIALRINTGGNAVNAVEGSVVFDPAKLEILSISRSNSILSIWATEPIFSNTEGTVEFTGGTPNPGYSGSNGSVLAINFRAKTATTVEGSTEVALVSGAILANDGYGTNILSSLGRASYAITASVIAPTPITLPSSVTADEKPNIISLTHPDPPKWYSNNNPTFKWNVPSTIQEVFLVLSRRNNSPPIISYSPPISEKQLVDLDEGEWYFNARFRTELGLGPVSSFGFNIDTEPPLPFSISRSDIDDPTNPRPELLFESSDTTSGIEYYELRINGGEPINVSINDSGRSYAMPLQGPGEKNLEIKAFDKAGNIRSSNFKVYVESITPPRLDSVSEYVREGEKIVVEGTAKSNQKIKISIVYYADDKEYKTYDITSDAKGKFTLSISELLTGKYKIYAYTQDERGAVSNPSNILLTEARNGFLDFLFKIFDRVVNLLSRGGLFMAFIAAIVGLVLVLIELIKLRAKGWIMRLKDSMMVKIIRKKSTKKVAHIVQDMQDELKFLSQIARRRPLSTEEKYLKGKISTYIKMLKYIDREID